MQSTRPNTKIIAEIGVNHNGSLDLAKEMIAAAARCGADCAKFQTFTADSLVTPNTPKAAYQNVQTDASESQYDMLKALELSEKDHEILIQVCKDEGIEFISTPFSIPAMDMLTDRCDLKTLKIGSGDLTNAPLLYAAARKNVDLILSTGMANLADVEEALKVVNLGYSENPPECPTPENFNDAWGAEEIRQTIERKVTVLQCTSNYPADIANANLKSMAAMGQIFKVAYGYSDHTSGSAASIAAVALGASVIEKHITTDKNLPGPDHQASIEPDEFSSLVSSIREVELALGTTIKAPCKEEYNTADVARKSLVAIQNIQDGEIFTENNLGFKRPGTGIRPIQWWQYLGKTALKAYRKDDLI